VTRNRLHGRGRGARSASSPFLDLSISEGRCCSTRRRPCTGSTSKSRWVRSSVWLTSLDRDVVHRRVIPLRGRVHTAAVVSATTPVAGSRTTIRCSGPVSIVIGWCTSGDLRCPGSPLRSSRYGRPNGRQPAIRSNSLPSMSPNVVQRRRVRCEVCELCELQARQSRSVSRVEVC